MRRWGILAVSLLFCTAQAEQGFVTSSSTEVPGAVEVGGDSILQIVMVGESPRQRIPKSDYAAILRNPSPMNLLQKMSVDRIAECAEKGSDVCEIYYTSTGTGFLAGDSSTLWTAAHVVQEAGKKLRAGERIKFELFDSKGNQLLDSRDSKDAATIVAIGDAEVVSKRYNVRSDFWWVSTTADFAKIKLSTPLALRPLTLNAKAPKTGEKLYSLGYPSVAEFSRLRQPANNKSNINSRVSFGRIIRASDLSQIKGKLNPKSLDGFNQQVSSTVMTFDLDGLPGQSGSPVMNERGEVLGIYTAVFHSVDQRERAQKEYNTEAIGPHFEGILKY